MTVVFNSDTREWVKMGEAFFAILIKYVLF